MKRFAWMAFSSAGLIVSVAMCFLYQARIGTDAEKASDPIVLAVWAAFAVIYSISLAILLVRMARSGRQSRKS